VTSATRQRLDGLGVAVPDARLIHDGAQLLDAAQDLGYPDRGLMLKPRRLAGGRGVWRVSARVDLTASGPYPSLPVEAMAVLLDRCPASAASEGFVLEHEDVGADTSVDVLAHEGKLLSVVTRTRETTLGGLSVAGCVVRPSYGAQAVAEAVVAGLAWSSLANIQVVEQPAGQPVVYEINPRASGSIGLAAHAGVDLLSAAVDLARHGSLSADLPSSVTTTVRFRRYWLDQAWAVAPTDPAPALALRASR
jgi:carbamoyl-phosphate synthase large subunit